jgi:hypothetical protein
VDGGVCRRRVRDHFTLPIFNVALPALNGSGAGAMIGYIAFPVRAFTERLLHGDALPASALFLSCSLASVSLSSLTKWTVGYAFGRVDARLDPAYLARLTRKFRIITVWNVAAAGLVWLWWPGGVAMSWIGVLAELQAPETLRYLTEAPTIEGES